MRRVLVTLTLLLGWLPVMAADDRMATALDHFKAMRNDKALRVFGELQRESPNNAEVLYYLGRLNLREYRFDESIRLLRRAIELAPNEPEYRLFLCEALGSTVEHASLLDQISMANEVYDNLIEAVKRNPGSITARDGLMHYYMQAPAIAGGSTRKALDQAAEIMKLNTGLGYVAKGDIAFMEKRYMDALAAYKKAVKRLPESPRPLYEQVKVYQAQGNFEGALGIIEQIDREFAGETATDFYRAENEILAGNINKRVVNLLESYIRKGRKVDDDPWMIRAYVELGQVQRRLGNNFFAYRAFKSALALNPLNQAALDGLDELD